MPVNDPIADFLTRIRNAAKAAHDEVAMPSSKVKVKIAEVLIEEGFLDDVTVVPDKKQGLLVVRLRYDEKGRPAIRGLRRMSTPGRRSYVKRDELPRVRNGFGIAIISTSRGLLTDQKARHANVGGEYLCSIW